MQYIHLYPVLDVIIYIIIYVYVLTHSFLEFTICLLR